MAGVTEEQESTAFRFVDLTAELRNAIYDLALVHEDKAIDVNPSARKPQSPSYSGVITIGLLKANRQLCAEATPVFYGMNAFTERDPFDGFDEKQLLRWLRAIGSHRRYLRTLHISMIGNQQVLKSALHLLKDAAYLDTLRVGWQVPHLFNSGDYAMVYPSRWLVDVDIILPWLRRLAEARKARGDARPISSVFQHQGVEDRFLTYLKTEEARQRSMAKYPATFSNMKVALAKRHPSFAT